MFLILFLIEKIIINIFNLLKISFFIIYNIFLYFIISISKKKNNWMFGRSLANRIKNFDVYGKMPKDLSEGTMSGALGIIKT